MVEGLAGFYEWMEENVHVLGVPWVDDLDMDHWDQSVENWKRLLVFGSIIV